MGYIPRPQTLDQQAATQNQSYMDQFNNSPYAAIPGVRGQQPIPATPPSGRFNNRPPGVNPTPTGWAAAGQLGNILPGIRSEWMNANLSNADWRSFLPQEQGPPPAFMHNQIPDAYATGLTPGKYGGQAAALAGLLGQPAAAAPAAATPAGGGMLGRPRGSRFPGGK